MNYFIGLIIGQAFLQIPNILILERLILIILLKKRRDVSGSVTY